MKHPVELKKKTKTIDEQHEDCRKRRGVKHCKDCCRYEHCYNGKPLFDPDDPRIECELKLANVIIYTIGDDYCKAWRDGKSNEYHFLKRVLLSQYVNIISGEQTNGEALENMLAKKCLQKYGSFNDCHAKRIKKYDELIATEKKKLAKTKDLKERKKIRDKIYKLEGKKYE